MNIDGISSSLIYFQGNLKPNSVDAIPAAKQVPEINEIDTRRDNLMADNFLDPNKEKSRYVDATLQSFHVRDVAGAKRAAIVAIVAAEIKEIDVINANAVKGGSKKNAANKYYSQVNQAEIIESSEDHLKSEREKLEEAAQGTPASGDAQGASVQAAPTSDSGSASTSEAEAAPLPEAVAASVDVTV